MDNGDLIIADNLILILALFSFWPMSWGPWTLGTWDLDHMTYSVGHVK